MEADNIIEDLYHSHARNIQRMCYLYLGDVAASEDAIRQLPQELREVVILFYYQELSTKTIGAILHIPRTTVEFRLKKARGELRKVIREDIL